VVTASLWPVSVICSTRSLPPVAVPSNGGDYTVHVVIGIDPKRRTFLLDLWRQQT
jgi:hypothetical protein